MLQKDIFYLIACVAFTAAIRVDFNTNKGPIVPALPRTTISPQFPFREPAPVWEDQSDDIPNPNPYKYVPPPPSRPRPTTNNYLTSDRKQPQWQKDYYYNNGKVISPNDIDSYYQKGGNHIVASLFPKYYPSIGFKYNAIVQQTTPSKSYYIKTPSSSIYYTDKPNKLNGKYNAKTKKHKVFDKIKYVPRVYYSSNTLSTFPIFHYELPTLHHQKYQQFLHQYQQLPLMQKPQSFKLINFKTANSGKKIFHDKKEFPEITTKKSEEITETTKEFLNNIIENAITRSSFDKKKTNES